MDHVLEDGSLVTKQVGPGQLEAGRLGEALDQAVHQIPEVGVKLLLALLRNSGAETPDDSEYEQNLEIDRVDLRENINLFTGHTYLAQGVTMFVCLFVRPSVLFKLV